MNGRRATIFINTEDEDDKNIEEKNDSEDSFKSDASF